MAQNGALKENMDGSKISDPLSDFGHSICLIPNLNLSQHVSLVFYGSQVCAKNGIFLDLHSWGWDWKFDGST